MADYNDLRALAEEPHWFEADDLYRFEAAIGNLPAAIYISSGDWDELLLTCDDDRAEARLELARLARTQEPSYSASGTPHFRVRYVGSASI